jgi:hypothetical protein
MENLTNEEFKKLDQELKTKLREASAILDKIGIRRGETFKACFEPGNYYTEFNNLSSGMAPSRVIEVV